MRLLALIPLIILATAAPAQRPAPMVQVRLTSFEFTPRTIRLRAGQPVVLHLVNPGRGGHNFSAPAFFRAARVAPESARWIRNGAIEVPSRRAVDIRLIPAPGRYRLRCTHTLHTAFGMSGSIIVG